MVYDIIIDVLSAWQVIAVGLLIMIVLPIVFYFASFDKNPVKIKRVPDKKRAEKGKRKGRAETKKQDGEEEKEEDNRDRRDRRGIVDDEEEESANSEETKSRRPANKKR